MHRFSVITLFPELVRAFAEVGLVRKARALALVEVTTVNPRDFAQDRRRTVDDVAYGGGPGMVMCVAPLRAAIRHVKDRAPAAKVIYLTPQGERLTQARVGELGAEQELILLAGRYEGIDERVVMYDVDIELSVGDYVLSGGELPALVLIDAIVRLIPGVMGDPQSAELDSFMDGLLDYPHYTRPEIIDGQAVPKVLLSGNHQAIAAWRLREGVRRTLARRPDLLTQVTARADIERLVAELVAEKPQKDL